MSPTNRVLALSLLSLVVALGFGASARAQQSPPPHASTILERYRDQRFSPLSAPPRTTAETIVDKAIDFARSHWVLLGLLALSILFDRSSREDAGAVILFVLLIGVVVSAA